MQKPRVERKAAAALCAGFSALQKLSLNSELTGAAIEVASRESRHVIERSARAS
jgi:hypothetical protein